MIPEAAVGFGGLYDDFYGILGVVLRGLVTRVSKIVIGWMARRRWP